MVFFLLMTMANIKANLVIVFSLKASIFITNTPSLLEYVSYIYYLIQLKKAQIKIQALINFGSKVNAITLLYVTKLSLKVRSTNIGA